MLDIIANNPFRTLGVYSNSKQADIVKNVSKMKAYLNVGRAVDFPTDMQGILPGLSRTVASAQAAQAAINLPNDKIRYALFWFCNADAVDATGLNNLASGDADKALSIFARRESFSSLVNRAVLALIKSDYQAAYLAYSQLVHDYTYRGQFCASVCGDTFQMSCLQGKDDGNRRRKQFKNHCQSSTARLLKRRAYRPRMHLRPYVLDGLLSGIHVLHYLHCAQ